MHYDPNNLQNSIVPKIEVTHPSMLEVTDNLLPASREWKVGQRYLLKLGVELSGQQKGTPGNPNDKNQLVSSFKVLGAESLEMGTKPSKRNLTLADAPKEKKKAKGMVNRALQSSGGGKTVNIHVH